MKLTFCISLIASETLCSSAMHKVPWNDGEEKTQGNLTSVYKYLKARCKETEVRLFPVAFSDKTRVKCPT